MAHVLPRPPVWEDAKGRGFVVVEDHSGRELVRITPAGAAFLQQRKISPKPDEQKLPD